MPVSGATCRCLLLRLIASTVLSIFRALQVCFRLWRLTLALQTFMWRSQHLGLLVRDLEPSSRLRIGPYGGDWAECCQFALHAEVVMMFQNVLPGFITCARCLNYCRDSPEDRYLVESTPLGEVSLYMQLEVEMRVKRSLHYVFFAWVATYVCKWLRMAEHRYWSVSLPNNRALI